MSSLSSNDPITSNGLQSSLQSINQLINHSNSQSQHSHSNDQLASIPLSQLINQSLNQSTIGQLLSQSAINHKNSPINQSLSKDSKRRPSQHQWNSPYINQSNDQSINQPNNQSINQSNNQYSYAKSDNGDESSDNNRSDPEHWNDSIGHSRDPSPDQPINRPFNQSNPHSNNQSINQSMSMPSETLLAKKRRHAQIDASRRARETSIIEQLKTLSGQRVESVKRDRLESLEIAVERFSTLMSELPRLQRLVDSLTRAAKRQGLIDANMDVETWANDQSVSRNQSQIQSPTNQSQDQSPTNQSINQSINPSSFDVVPEEDAEMYLTALSDLIRSRPFHSLLQSINQSINPTSSFMLSSAPLCAVRMRDARMMAINQSMISRLQWRHEPHDLIGLQCVDLWFILADLYRRVASIPFPALDTNQLLIQSTGVVSTKRMNQAINQSNETCTPLINQHQHVINEVIRLLSGCTDVIDVEFLAPATSINQSNNQSVNQSINQSVIAQKRRCRVWLTKGWQSMAISNVEMMFHLISVNVGPVDIQGGGGK